MTPASVVFEAGTLAVWVVDPRARTVTVHEPGQLPSVFGKADLVPGGELLPGFELVMRDMFA